MNERIEWIAKLNGINRSMNALHSIVLYYSARFAIFMYSCLLSLVVVLCVYLFLWSTIWAIVLMCVVDGGVCVHQVQRWTNRHIQHTLLTPFHLCAWYWSASNRMEMKMRMGMSVWISMQLPENRKIPIIKIDDSNKNLLPFFSLSLSFSQSPVHIFRLVLLLLLLIPDSYILLPVHPPHSEHNEFCIRLWREHVVLYLCEWAVSECWMVRLYFFSFLFGFTCERERKYRNEKFCWIM